MGKPTGFLDYKRQTAEAVTPKERIENFNEFHTPLSQEEQRKQGARCMACGVPFCQSGMDIMGMTSAVRCTIWCRNGMTWFIQETGNRRTNAW